MKLHTPLAWEIKRGYYETARICQTCYEKSAGIGLPNLPPVWPAIADLLAALSHKYLVSNPGSVASTQRLAHLLHRQGQQTQAYRNSVIAASTCVNSYLD